MSRDKQTFTFKVSAKSLPRPLLGMARRALERLMGYGKFNAAYAELPACAAADFPRTFLDAMQISATFAGTPPDAIPATGPLIVVANHPTGLIEVLALDAMLLRRRADVTFMTNYIFGAIPELRERYILVDPLGGRRQKLNSRGWRESFQWLARGGALGIFPAGRVAGFQWGRMRIADQPWSPHIAAIARRSKTPVLPVWFHGRNGWWFQLAGMLHPRLQDLMFVREITNKRGMALRATIGPLVGPEQLSRFATDDEATEFLRQETEKLRFTGE